MPFEPAIVFMIEGVAIVVFLLFIPFLIAVSHVPSVWGRNRGAAVLLVGVILWTMVAYGTLLGTFWGLVYSGSQAE